MYKIFTRLVSWMHFLGNWNPFHWLWCLCNSAGFTFQRMSSSCFEISETVVKDSITTLACLWNKGVRHIQALAHGEDWSNFLKVWTWIHGWLYKIEPFSVFDLTCGAECVSTFYVFIPFSLSCNNTPFLSWGL